MTSQTYDPMTITPDDQALEEHGREWQMLVAVNDAAYQELRKASSYNYRESRETIAAARTIIEDRMTALHSQMIEETIARLEAPTGEAECEVCGGPASFDTLICHDCRLEQSRH